MSGTIEQGHHGSTGERDTLGTQQDAVLLAVKAPAPTEVNDPAASGASSKQQQLSFPLTNRHDFDANKMVREIWTGLDMPEQTLVALSLPGSTEAPSLPSSFKLGILAQGTIGLSSLLAAQLHALRNGGAVPAVEVPLEHAVVEFKSEKLYLINGKRPVSTWGLVGGLHKTSDGYIRIHDSFPNHINGAMDLVGLAKGSSRDQLAEKVAPWASIDLETAGVVDGKLAMYALRSYDQWDALPQSRAINSFPIDIRQISPEGPKGLPPRLSGGSSSCLQGLRVIEMSRVIAAPLAGRTLAAHGADVIWVTSPGLPDIPNVDRDMGRGKRTVQLDITRPADKARLLELLRTADVFIQGFRPGALASQGLAPEELVKINPGLVVANMSAFGPRGPWAGRRGFDSLVQTASGMNVSEAQHAGRGEPARPMPCQALDHAGGYLLAVGLMAGVYRRATQGGSWLVDVSLAGVMKYLRSLGQYPGASGFEAKDYTCAADVPDAYYETRESGFGSLKAIRHSARIEGVTVGWDVMPKPLGSDQPEWLS
jgi:crotonobetainyl-CoA:carnitine CoA-transferase CaiB-like acyl-CoA transferase